MTTKFTRFPYLTLSYQIDLDPISALIDLDSVCSSASAFERRASTCANIASACHEEKRKRHCGQDSSDPRTTDNHVCKCMQAMHGRQQPTSFASASPPLQFDRVSYKTAVYICSV